MDEELLGYVTITEADLYVEQFYLSTDSLRLFWEDLDDDDKTVLLRKSFQLLEMLPFIGQKMSSTQAHAWPRKPWGENIPEAIKFAQIEQALSLGDTAATEEYQQYAKLRTWGVTSYKIGNLSEQLNAGTGTAVSGLTSVAAQQLLRPYLQGGYRII